MEPLLSIEDSAKALAISPWTVRAFCKSGRLNPVRLGRRVLLEPSELRRFIDQAKGGDRLDEPESRPATN